MRHAASNPRASSRHADMVNARHDAAQSDAETIEAHVTATLAVARKLSDPDLRQEVEDLALNLRDAMPSMSLAAIVRWESEADDEMADDRFMGAW
jgi:hypothetical protein